MNERESKIHSLVEELVGNKDIASLDVLFTIAFHQTGITAYGLHTKLFERIIGKLAGYTLKLKYGLNAKEREENINVLDRLHEECDVGYDDFELLRFILSIDAKDAMSEDIERRIEYLGEIEKEVLVFILHYLSLKSEESRSLALESGKEGFKFISDLGIETDDKNNIIYYTLSNFDELTVIFNRLFNREIGHSQTIRIPSKKPTYIDGKFRKYKEYKELCFWDIGDILVKTGIAYQVPWITSSKDNPNIFLEMVIPKYLCAITEKYRYLLPETADLEKEIKKIEKPGITARRHYYTSDDECSSSIIERDIEDLVESDPEVLEKGLRLKDRQKTTDAGIIDILCLDENNNYVVIELKKGVASDKVVGQIQRYMVWVEKNLSDKESVRGMIVAQGHDKKLEYAIEGSKYPIEVKIFGEDAPIEENIKYCDNCGISNRKSAKFCVKCGNEFWFE